MRRRFTDWAEAGCPDRSSARCSTAIVGRMDAQPFRERLDRAMGVAIERRATTRLRSRPGQPDSASRGIAWHAGKSRMRYLLQAQTPACTVTTSNVTLLVVGRHIVEGIVETVKDRDGPARTVEPMILAMLAIRAIR